MYNRQQILRDAANEASLTDGQKETVNQRRRTVLTRLRPFRENQRIYMPASVLAIQEEDAQRNRELPPLPAEQICLWLPSQLPPESRSNGCSPGICDIEARLREAQCNDALDDVRTRLQTRYFLISTQKKRAAGQREGTRARTLLDRVSLRTEQASTLR